MTRKRTTNPASTKPALGAEADDPFAPGAYVTDGTALFNVVGRLPDEPSLRLVEDCATLEILMVHVDVLRAPGVRRVQPSSSDEGDVRRAEHAEDERCEGDRCGDEHSADRGRKASAVPARANR